MRGLSGPNSVQNCDLWFASGFHVGSRILGPSSLATSISHYLLARLLAASLLVLVPSKWPHDWSERH